jgi:hypothetical protein
VPLQGAGEVGAGELASLVGIEDLGPTVARKRFLEVGMQSHGLEWLFRVYQEPRRLTRRYVYSIARFLLEIAAQKTGLHRYSCDP